MTNKSRNLVEILIKDIQNQRFGYNTKLAEIKQYLLATKHRNNPLSRSTATRI